MKYFVILLNVLFLGIGIAMTHISPEQFVEAGSILAVIMISLPAFYGMYVIHGNRAFIAILALGLLALTIETIGIYTGFPYSPFEYTMPFGYQLFATTPWTVMIAWSPLVVGAYLLSKKWFKKSWIQLLGYLGLLISTDLVLDPGAVARGLWAYENIGLWYEVPLQNFLGWVFSGIIAYLILEMFLRKKTIISHNLIIASLSLTLSLALWSGITLAYAMYLPAAIGITILIIINRFLIKKPML